MTITKKQWMMLLLGAGVLFLVYWFFFRNKKTKTESSYDDNLMIFGNENGYGPADGAYGSYGYESGLIGKGTSTIVVEKKSGKCDCDSSVTGICFKSEKKGALQCSTGTLAPATSTVGKESLRQRCRAAGGQMGTCYKNGSSVGYPCCSMSAERLSGRTLGPNKCDCFNGILTDSLGRVLKNKDGSNRTCTCNNSAE